jgi:uncharacterized protein (TIGR00299 family) protein
MIKTMEKTCNALVFDPFSGASGDMIIGSLLSLGADKIMVKEAMESTASVSVTISETKKGQISATRVDVVQNVESQSTYEQMVDQIRSARLPEVVRNDALGIMELLGTSESEVHGTPLNELHLHEVGQQDAVADIVGAACAFHNLELSDSHVYCMPVSVGAGCVDTAHGRLPVPAPATLAILNASHLIWQGGPVEHELFTPTGAAILAYLTEMYGSSCTVYPQLTSSRAGYGAGSKELGMPNVLRTVLGELDPGLATDHIEMLETNVDDVTGEVLGYLIQQLMDDGALDISILPAFMKKGRIGSLIKVICNVEDAHRLARRIMVETGSLGVRLVPVRHRLTARRTMMEVEIITAAKPHKVGVKVACDNRGNILNISAEFEDCRKIAEQTGLPVKDIIHRAQEAARVRLGLE